MLGTSDMGGKIVLSVLQKDNGHIDYVHVEMVERGIVPPMPLKKTKLKEVTNVLNIDEYKRLIGLELAQDIDHWTRVLEIEPQSKKND